MDSFTEWKKIKKNKKTVWQKTQSIYNGTVAEENFQKLIPVVLKDYLELSVKECKSDVRQTGIIATQMQQSVSLWDTTLTQFSEEFLSLSFGISLQGNNSSCMETQ